MIPEGSPNEIIASVAAAAADAAAAAVAAVAAAASHSNVSRRIRMDSDGLWWTLTDSD